jgi:glycosyltransferase involved in cell wall biosynthesis
MKRGLILIPAYNEADTITAVIERARAKVPELELVVVDDGSSDATSSLVKQLGVTVLIHPFNLGYGAALQTGYRYALDHSYDYAVQIDADGQHLPEEIVRLAAPVVNDTVDIALGSRFHDASSYEMPALKRMGSMWFGWLVRVTAGLHVTDPTSGMQALSRRALHLYASELFPSDYPDADVLVFAKRHGLRIEEVPVAMEQRLDSASMHSGLSVFYYVYKMTLSILMNLVRPKIEP